MLLSICIATRNRKDFLLETIRCILDQISNDVEIIIVDGASTDGSKEKIESLRAPNNKIKYFYEEVNSGVDRDFDKAIEYASGKYCWLFSDDDLLEKNSISTIKNLLKENHDLLVINSSIHTKFFEKILCSNILNPKKDILYNNDGEKVFHDLASYLSFIGAIIVKREFWMKRSRKAHHGSAFAHIGVLFQDPLPKKVFYLSEPLIKIRYGNSEWAPRGFKIWFNQWPKQIMKLNNLPYELRKKIANNGINGAIKFCILYRAMSLYDYDTFIKFVNGKFNRVINIIFLIISITPIKMLNLFLILGLLFNNSSLVNIYRLSNSNGASKLSLWAANKFRLNKEIYKNE